MKNKNVLIVFPDEWICYSPTVINLAYCFKQQGDNVKIIAMRNGDFKYKDIKNINIKFINTSNYTKELFDDICSYSTYKLLLLVFNLLKERKKYDIVIGVDSIGYLACKLCLKNPVYLSLEVAKDKYFKMCSFLGIKKIIIQSKERKEYLIKDNSVAYEELPNSPIYRNISTRMNKEKRIIYFGNICKEHGVFDCIESLKYLDEDFSLELHGILKLNIRKEIFLKYSKYIKEGRLILSDDYILEENIIQYLSDYYIGLCFYDFNLIGKHDFNYVSCPSGKLYNYYAAELPVVGNDILGLKSCKEYNCGILLKDITPLNIAKAVMRIDENYEKIKMNCKTAAEKNDFYIHFKKMYNNL